MSLSVAIVVESLHTRGGVERRTSELVKGLLGAGHRVHIYANRWDADLALDVEFHHVPMVRLTRALKASSFAWFCGRMVRGYDLVHTQARIDRYDLATLGVGCHRAYMDAMGIDPEPVSPLPSPPRNGEGVARGSAVTPSPLRGGLGRGETVAGRDKAFHRATLRIEQSMFTPGNYRHIITNSAMCKRELGQYYDVPADGITVVHNGVDHDTFSPSVRAERRKEARIALGLSPDDMAVLYVGTGFDRKGLDTLITSLGMLKPRNARLVIVGRGDVERFGRLAAHCGVGDRLIWAGKSDDVARYYAAADVFALPTRYDPFANSTMEALASGVPTVTTRSNGVSEILRDGSDAFVTDADDPAALADRLCLLIEDSDLRERIGEAGCRASEPFTWERTTQETLAVYEKLTCQPSP